jgi:hypothetical protein
MIALSLVVQHFNPVEQPGSFARQLVEFGEEGADAVFGIDDDHDDGQVLGQGKGCSGSARQETVGSSLSSARIGLSPPMVNLHT